MTEKEDAANSKVVAKERVGARRSTSVQTAIRRNAGKDVSAAMLAADILVTHSHYGANRGQEFAIILKEQNNVVKSGELKPATQWVEEISTLYQDEAIISGRCVVVGLALLDPLVRMRLLSGGFLAALSTETRDGPSVANRLVPDWKKVLADVLDGRTGTTESGSVETFSDSPSAADQLGRRAFADVLAARIRRLRANEPRAPIVLHLDGPWGSGKSTIFNFLESSLTASTSAGDAAWIVLRYNAWQQQRLDTPWWTLAARLTDASFKNLAKRHRYLAAIRLWIQDYYFKTFSGRTWVFVAGLIALATGVGLFRYTFPATTSLDMAARALALAAKDLLSVAAAVFGIVVATSRFLTASDTTAQAFIKSRADPLGALTDHLGTILQPVGRNFAILVDDIDRCDTPTVVKTLEGIHTVFTALPIVFIVAGEGRWIEQAFEKTYADSARPRPDGGQTLGGLFLEKLFQISASIPRMPAPIKDAFWMQLLRVAENGPTDDAETETSDMSALRDEKDILAAVAAVDARQDPRRALRLRESAMRRLAAPDLIEKPVGHVLEVFRDSVESNPRAMKRQVMAYGMARATDLASFRDTPQNVLATLSVLSLRWPTLARWLSERPKRVLLMSAGNEGDVVANEGDEIFVSLMRSAAVTRLFKHLGDLKALENALGPDDDVVS
jgi:hypothetical protein